jgi:caffeoyl-CoA O-methyltransferase
MSRSIGLDSVIVDYLAEVNPPETAAMRRCRAETAALGQQARMQVSAEQGAFMAMLVRIMNARLAVEVGTFTGYSALAIAEALRRNAGPGARLWACDLSAEWLARAQGYWDEAGLGDVIEPRPGPADATLEALAADGLAGRIDLVFIDADKTGYAGYLERALVLLRPGGVILFDNMLWGGSVARPEADDADTVALRTLAAGLRDDPRVEAMMAAIGDGVSIVRKKGGPAA